jgi:hypothetical protein
MCRATFKHIPLARPAEQIRLLKLEPGADVIRLNIQTYELTEYLRFVALSYEWGHGSEIHDIIIDGEVFKIRQNLRDALEHIRTLQADTSSRRLFEEDSPYFWIDAIAIDQSNDTEKPHQISIMGKIYRQASHVIAWLGLEQNGDDSALALNYLNPDIEVPRDHQEQSPDLVTISAEQMAIRRLCDRSYFRRIWIVQECVLARKLHLVCGLHYCFWEHLHNFNRAIRFGLRSWPVDELFDAKSVFERGRKDMSIQQLMSRILDVAADRKCSRFHDRIYGLLGILQQNFQTTGMVVDYGVSLEELMIKTQEFLTSDPQDDNPYNYPYRIVETFKSVVSTDIQGKVAWYWQINEIMYKLEADVFKGFHSLKALRGEKERVLTFQTITWIVGGYGVDLFSSVGRTISLDIATTIQSHRPFPLTTNPRVSGKRVFIVHSRYTIGTYTYCICLKHQPQHPYCMPNEYEMTEPNSWGCRGLLETYSKHVRSLGELRESLRVSTRGSDLETPSPLPIQIQWMLFSNLLAQHFLSRFSEETLPNRRTETDGFVRQIEQGGKDLGAFLSDSLFNKYRMKVADTTDRLPKNALKSVKIEITRNNDAGECSDFIKKTMVASLYDNDACNPRIKMRCVTS